jgi:hypothetical protein
MIIDSMGTVLLEVSGTFVASITIKGSLDGTNFNSTLAVEKLDTGVRSNAITATGTYKVQCPAGLQKLRTPVTWTSGTSVTVKGRATPFNSNDNSMEVATSTIPKTQPIPIVKAPVRVISTIINAVSKAAGTNTGAVSLGLDGTEDEVWLAINIDKQPWTLSSTNVFGNDLAACNYPIYASHATAYASGGLPAISLVLGIAPSNQLGAPVATFAEARNVRQPYTSAITCAIANGHATDTATITVKVIRVWR